VYSPVSFWQMKILILSPFQLADIASVEMVHDQLVGDLAVYDGLGLLDEINGHLDIDHIHLLLGVVLEDIQLKKQVGRDKADQLVPEDVALSTFNRIPSSQASSEV